MKRAIIISIIFLLFTSIYPVYVFAQQWPPEVERILSTLDSDTRATIEEKLQQMFPDGFTTLEDVQLQIIKNTLEVITTPVSPGPYDNVTIKIKSYSTDLNRAEFFWYLDNKLSQKGIGENTFQFKVKESGSITKVAIVIKTASGQRIDKQFTFNPVTLDILWEANTYTPPFYKGKALLSAKSWLKVVATPDFISTNGKKLNENNLVYLWKKDGEILEDSSGYGKNVLLIKGPREFGSANIEVSASSFYNTLSSTQKVEINLNKPRVILYEDRPIQGVWYEDTVGQNFDLSNQELVIKAEPYFFAKNDIKVGNLEYNWSLNGENITGEDNKLTLRQEGGGGTARVGIYIKNIAKTFQSARESFLLNFKGVSLFNF